MELALDKKKEEQQINQNRYQAGNAPLSQPGMAEKLGNKVKNEAMNKGMELGKEQLASFAAPTATAAQTAGLQALAPVAGGLSPGASMAVMGNAGMAGTTGATLASGAGAAGAGAAGAGAMAALGPIGIGLAADELLGLGIRKKVLGFDEGGQVGPLSPQYHAEGTMSTMPMMNKQLELMKGEYYGQLPGGYEGMSYSDMYSFPEFKQLMYPSLYKSQGGPISPQYNAQGTMTEEQARALMNNQPKPMPQPPRRRPNPYDQAMASKGYDPMADRYVSSESLSPPGFSEEMAKYMQAIGQPFGGRQ